MKNCKIVAAVVLAGLLSLPASVDAAKKEKPAGADNRAVFVLTDFGADPTGKEDASPAFDRLFKAMDGRKYVEVYVPAGQFRITRRIVFDQKQFEGFEFSSGLHFRGAGEDATEILCDNGEGGFFFNAATNKITVTVSDMSFVTARQGEGTAVEFDTAGHNPGDQHSRMFQARNLLIRGITANEGYFENGVVVRNAWYPMLENVKVTNIYGWAGENMDHGFFLYNCYSPLVDKCYMWGHGNYGMRVLSTKYDEDGIFANCYFVGQDIGLSVNLSDHRGGWGEPAFHLTGCHIHYKKKGVEITGVRQGFIQANLIYCGNTKGSRWWNRDETADPFESIDVELTGANDFIIANNMFVEPGTPYRVNIDILPTSGDILICNNIFNNDGGVAIRNRSLTASRCIGNVFTGTPDFTRANERGKQDWDVAKNATGEVVLVRYQDEPGTLVIRDFEE